MTAPLPMGLGMGVGLPSPAGAPAAGPFATGTASSGSKGGAGAHGVDPRLLADRFAALLAEMEVGAPADPTATGTSAAGTSAERGRAATDLLANGMPVPRSASAMPKAEREALTALRAWLADVSGVRADDAAMGGAIARGAAIGSAMLGGVADGRAAGAQARTGSDLNGLTVVPPSAEELDALLDAMAEAVESAAPAAVSVGAPTSTPANAASGTLAISVPSALPTHESSARRADAADHATRSADARGAARTGVARSGDAAMAVRDLEALHPELKIRVERVVTRMREEFGHVVEVVETLRSGERQDALYAQGRTAPGPVVTWTRESLHEHGAAADLQVDGRWDDPVAYARLQRIAREEGLATLGTKDAGHVEWRDGRTMVARGAHADGEASVSVRGSGPMAQPAAVAQVAQVATVAQPTRMAQVASVAQVARVATPGASGAARREPTRTTVRPEAPAVPATMPPAMPVHATDRASSAAAASTVVAARPHATGVPIAPQGDLRDVPEVSDAAAGTEAASLGSADTTAMAAPMPGLGGERGDTADAAPSRGADAAAATTQTERIAELDALEDTRRQQPLQSLTLRVEDAQGQDHRIRVDLRGQEVHADITTASGRQAQALADALPELRQRLGQQGLDAGTMQVRSWITDANGAAGDRSAAERGDGQQRQQHEQRQQQHDQSSRDPRDGQTATRRRFDLFGDLA